MKFVVRADFDSLITEAELNEVCPDPANLDQSLLIADQTIRSYLVERYDLDGSMPDAGALLGMYGADIALYHLFTSISPDKVPALRKSRYDQAIRWLELVAAGKISPGIGLRRETATKSLHSIVMKSNPKFNL